MSRASTPAGHAGATLASQRRRVGARRRRARTGDAGGQLYVARQVIAARLPAWRRGSPLACAMLGAAHLGGHAGRRKRCPTCRASRRRARRSSQAPCPAVQGPPAGCPAAAAAAQRRQRRAAGVQPPGPCRRAAVPQAVPPAGPTRCSRTTREACAAAAPAHGVHGVKVATWPLGRWTSGRSEGHRPGGQSADCAAASRPHSSQPGRGTHGRPPTRASTRGGAAACAAGPPLVVTGQWRQHAA